jgi:hypothetical protein
MVSKVTVVTATIAAILSAAKLSSAQGAAPAPAAPQPVPPPAEAAVVVAPPPPQPQAPVEVTDHDRFVHHVGFTYFDIANFPIATANGGVGTVVSPVIGMRYWISHVIGIDAGIGFGWSGGSSTVDTGVMSTTTNAPNPLGFGLHGGLPITLGAGQHFALLVIPELTVGFTTANIQQTGSPDTSLTGFLVRVGGRIGGEIHFGFIGVPELALQATLGLFLDYSGTKESIGNTSSSTTATSFATSVQGAPWAIFSNTISATYYL